MVLGGGWLGKGTIMCGASMCICWDVGMPAGKIQLTPSILIMKLSNTDKCHLLFKHHSS